MKDTTKVGIISTLASSTIAATIGAVVYKMIDERLSVIEEADTNLVFEDITEEIDDPGVDEQTTDTLDDAKPETEDE